MSKLTWKRSLNKLKFGEDTVYERERETERKGWKSKVVREKRDIIIYINMCLCVCVCV